MLIVTKQDVNPQDLEKVLSLLKNEGLQYSVIKGVECDVIGVVGDTSVLDREELMRFPGVDKILKVQEPYKKANRKFHPDDTIVQIGDVKIGNGGLTVIAGPCSVESEQQITDIARSVALSGAQILRGGAFKPRTSPYAFQGLEKEGLELLRVAREATGLPFVTEVMSPRYVEVFEMMADMIQIGARNMQNFDLLREVGKTRKPILLKRGLSSTIEEWLMSAEYIMAEGNPNVVLCERGIRTFEQYTRNTLDISAILAVKKLSHLPIIVDPSHASGKSWMVRSLALAAIAAGADGVMIEVHNDPQNALCDGQQSITPEEFNSLMRDVRILKEALKDVKYA